MVEFLALSRYRAFLKRCVGVIPDLDDVPYVAAALSVNGKVWSNDPHLKRQSLVPVLTTKELLDLFLLGEV